MLSVRRQFSKISAELRSIGDALEVCFSTLAHSHPQSGVIASPCDLGSLIMPIIRDRDE